jgi:helix-turn-helix protein
MSIELTNAVWKRSRQKKSGALVVLLAIADYANADGIAWPAVPTLARKARMSKRNVQRWLSALQRDGELKVLRNEGRRGSNIYKICLPVAEVDKGDTRGTNDNGAAKPVTPMSSTNDASVIQSVNEPSIQSTPVVPKGDDMSFWIKVSFDCFKQPVHPVRLHVLRALSAVVAALNKNHADSLVEFYQAELLDSKKPPYSSRRHSPERLMLDLPRQLALAVETCPPPKKYDFTIEDVREYLRRTYPECTLPNSFDELNSWRFSTSVRSEVWDAMRKRKEGGVMPNHPL